MSAESLSNRSNSSSSSSSFSSWKKEMASKIGWQGGLEKLATPSNGTRSRAGS